MTFPRPAIHLHKVFQLYKRNLPEFQELEDMFSLDEAMQTVLQYMADEKYAATDPAERMACPNIQILLTY